MPKLNSHPAFPQRHDCRSHEQVPPTSMLPLWRRVHQELMIRGQKWELPTNVSMVLVHLHLHPEDSEPAAMAAANYFPRQTITFILDALERGGLAVRRPHPNDRRRKLVVLTPKGRQKAEGMVRDMVRFESAALRTIKDVDLPRLQSFLTRYADALAAQNDRDLKTGKYIP
jgi:MarR family transcriptional regulator, transcriptional regulator for hemolysin